MKHDSTYQESVRLYLEILSEHLVEIARIQKEQGPQSGRLMILIERFERWNNHYKKLIEAHADDVSKEEQE